jgi:hypothetical protein
VIVNKADNIKTERTTTSHLKKIAHKKTQDMTMKIKVLVLDRQKVSDHLCSIGIQRYTVSDHIGPINSQC